MGIESFYISLQLSDEIPAQQIRAIIRANEIYDKFINPYFDADESTYSFSASIVSFFPMCEHLYRLCTEIAAICPIAYISTRDEYRVFDFPSSLDFFCWMYAVWDDKIRYFRESWGDFLVHPSDYYDSRAKLKKYYVKAP